jgi:hypothetical protein
MAVSVLNYSCENWALNPSNKEKIASAKMKFPRLEIWNRLNAYNLKNEIKTKREIGMKHISRKDKNSLSKIVMSSKP